jgi:prepilin-type N-terminal cleavage/methylation domain-containing protein
VRGASLKGVWKDRWGYTLPEALTAIAIAGLLAAISLVILLVLLERWRVEAAANQLAADMRLAHANTTQQLTDWRVVLMPTASRSPPAPTPTTASPS